MVRPSLAAWNRKIATWQATRAPRASSTGPAPVSEPPSDSGWSTVTWCLPIRTSTPMGACQVAWARTEAAALAGSAATAPCTPATTALIGSAAGSVGVGVAVVGHGGSVGSCGVGRTNCHPAASPTTGSRPTCGRPGRPGRAQRGDVTPGQRLGPRPQRGRRRGVERLGRERGAARPGGRAPRRALGPVVVAAAHAVGGGRVQLRPGARPRRSATASDGRRSATRPISMVATRPVALRPGWAATATVPAWRADQPSLQLQGEEQVGELGGAVAGRGGVASARPGGRRGRCCPPRAARLDTVTTRLPGRGRAAGAAAAG